MNCGSEYLSCTTLYELLCLAQHSKSDSSGNYLVFVGKAFSLGFLADVKDQFQKVKKFDLSFFYMWKMQFNVQTTEFNPYKPHKH